MSRVRSMRACGPSTGPTACALAGRRCSLWGWRKGVPGGGGVPSTAVRGAWCQALSLPRPPVLWSGQPGFRDQHVPGAVGAGVGTQFNPENLPKWAEEFSEFLLLTGQQHADVRTKCTRIRKSWR